MSDYTTMKRTIVSCADLPAAIDLPSILIAFAFHRGVCAYDSLDAWYLGSEDVVLKVKDEYVDEAVFCRQDTNFIQKSLELTGLDEARSLAGHAPGSDTIMNHYANLGEDLDVAAMMIKNVKQQTETLNPLMQPYKFVITNKSAYHLSTAEEEKVKAHEEVMAAAEALGQYKKMLQEKYQEKHFENYWSPDEAELYKKKYALSNSKKYMIRLRLIREKIRYIQDTIPERLRSSSSTGEIYDSINDNEEEEIPNIADIANEWAEESEIACDTTGIVEENSKMIFAWKLYEAPIIANYVDKVTLLPNRRKDRRISV
ncbi:hypothetical protein DFQ28_000942 [Apophysomyces sp. BC1034]|nr:hypothetical protein DFQ29_006903 [Apophysomyces sp. BC1021]KAG0194223.1 hypothetical protein DFQ28_000942 [Apophysomyces sp. BC1034]